MKNLLIPAKYAFILLALFQLYSIFHHWGQDVSKVVLSMFIFVGCVLFVFAEIFFNKEVNSNRRKGS